MKINKKLAAMIMAGVMFATSTVNVFAATNKKDITYNGRTYSYNGKQEDGIFTDYQYKDKRGNSIYFSTDPKSDEFNDHTNWHPQSEIASQIMDYDSNTYDPGAIYSTNHKLENSIIDGTYDKTSSVSVDDSTKAYLDKETLSDEELHDFINVAHESVSRVTGESLKGGTIVNQKYYTENSDKASFEDIMLILETDANKMKENKESRLKYIESLTRKMMQNNAKRDIIGNNGYTTKQLVNMAVKKMKVTNPNEYFEDIAVYSILDYYDVENKYTFPRNIAIDNYDASMTDIGNYIAKYMSSDILSDSKYKNQIEFATENANTLQEATDITIDYNNQNTYIKKGKDANKKKNTTIATIKDGIYATTLEGLREYIYAVPTGGNNPKDVLNLPSYSKILQYK